MDRFGQLYLAATAASSLPVAATKRYLYYELVNGTPIFRRRLETGLPIGIAALNADGTQLAIGTTKGEMILWDVKSGERLTRELPRFQSALYTAAFSPDGRLLAAGGRSKSRQRGIWRRVLRCLFPMFTTVRSGMSNLATTVRRW